MQKIILQNQEVQYAVNKSRRARRLRISVSCDAGVLVTVPYSLNIISAERFLLEHAAWILEKLRYYKHSANVINFPKRAQDLILYKKQARDFVRQKIEIINLHYNFSFNKITIKNQKSRWGSCSRQGNLNFSYKIVFLPEKLGEYIVAHELCHLKELNHSHRFWKLVSQTIPDYKSRVRELRRITAG